MRQIVIIGSPRSGTTAVANLLSSANECAPPLPECTYISRLLGVYHDIVEFSDKPRFDAYAISRNNLKENFKMLIAKLIENAASQVLAKSDDFMVFKDPMLTSHVDLIYDFFEPQAKIVWVVRHPIGIIASQMSVAKKQNPHAFKEDRESLFSEIVSNVYNDFHVVMNSKSFKSKKFFIAKYDDLIDENDVEINNLEKFTTLRFKSDELKVNPFGMDKNDATYSDGYNMSLFKTSPSFVLSDREARRVLSAFWGIIEKLEIKTDRYSAKYLSNETYEWPLRFALVRNKLKEKLKKLFLRLKD